MHAGRVGDFADDGIFLQIDHDHFRRVREIKPTRRRIDVRISQPPSPPIGISVIN